MKEQDHTKCLMLQLSNAETVVPMDHSTLPKLKMPIFKKK